MKATETFLQLYKEYETLLREKGRDPKSVEEEGEGQIQNRLRICRQFRNYLSHNHDPGFLFVSDEQIEFLQDQIWKLKMEDDILKKHIKSVATGTCSVDDKCIDALQKMRRLKSTKVVTIKSDGTYGIADVLDVGNEIIRSKVSRMSGIPLTKRYKFCKPDQPMTDLPNTIIICTDDGSAKGKLLGVYYQ